MDGAGLGQALQDGLLHHSQEGTLSPRGGGQEFTEQALGAGPSEAAVPAPQMRAPCLKVDTPEEVAPGGHCAWEGTHLEGMSGGHLSQCRTAQGGWALPTVQRGWQGGFAASETITRDPRSRPASPIAGCAPLPAPPLPAQGPPPSRREAHGHGG